MDLGTPGDVDKTDAIGVANVGGKREVVALLERFKGNSEETRHRVRVELGYADELAAMMCALVVFVSDRLLEIPAGVTAASPALCCRFAGLAKEIIPAWETEVAFRDLALELLVASI